MDSMSSTERVGSDEVCLFELAMLVDPLVSSSFQFSSSRALFIQYRELNSHITFIVLHILFFIQLFS